MNAIFPPSSFQVRQLAQYGRVDAAIPGTVTLMQMGEAGTPYASILTRDLVTSALAAGGNLNLAAGLSEIVFGLDQGAGAVTLSVNQGELQVSPALRASTVNATFVNSSGVRVNGVPVATQADLAADRAASVTSFNQRAGDVLLETADILRAGGAPQDSPVFSGWVVAPSFWDTRICDDTVVTANWVHRAIRAAPPNFSTEDINEAYAVPGPPWPQAPSPVLGDASDRIATTSFVDESLEGLAPVYSPQFSGRPTAPTQPSTDSSTALATTAFVQATVVNTAALPLAGGTMTGSINMTPGTFYQYGGKNLAYLVHPTSGSDNIFLGEAGNVTITGNSNVAVGPSSGLALTTGGGNTAVGASAMKALLTGNSTVAVGSFALATEAGGNFNTGVGSFALNTQAGATGNTALGYQAGYDLTTGGSNTIVGYNCGRGLATGTGNFIAGYNVTGIPAALATSMVLASGTTFFSIVNVTNAFHGGSAGNLTLTGTANTGIGWQAGRAFTSGSNNTAVGSTALLAETTGAVNVAVGRNALTAQNGGTGNTAVGSSSGAGVTTGSQNIFIGNSAGTGVTTGSTNIILGNVTGLTAATSNVFAYTIGSSLRYDWNLTTANTHTFAGGPVVGPQVLTTPVNVSALPAPTAALTGARAFVNDATATTFLSIVAGAGANKVPVVCNGTNWLIG